MSNKSTPIVATMEMSSCRCRCPCVVGLDRRGAIMLRQKWSRSQDRGAGR